VNRILKDLGLVMLAYAIKLEPDDNGTLLVTCPDLPGVVTFGEDREDAIRKASGRGQAAVTLSTLKR
jgi:antitoxin HicB